MPSLSAKQHRFMGWSKSHPGAKGAAPPDVAQEFLAADRGRHFEHGGVVSSSQIKPAFMRARR